MIFKLPVDKRMREDMTLWSARRDPAQTDATAIWQMLAVANTILTAQERGQAVRLPQAGAQVPARRVVVEAEPVARELAIGIKPGKPVQEVELSPAHQSYLERLQFAAQAATGKKLDLPEVAAAAMFYVTGLDLQVNPRRSGAVGKLQTPTAKDIARQRQQGFKPIQHLTF